MTLPSHCDLRRGIRSWQALGNLTNNDCTVAAYMHLTMVHNLAAASSWQRLLYRVGFRPPHNAYATAEYVDFLRIHGMPRSSGVDPAQFLAWEQSKGRVLDYQTIDISGPDPNAAIRQAMVDWDGCLLALEMTEEAYQIGTSRGAWILKAGQVVEPTLAHAVALVAYTPTMNAFVTWGIMKEMDVAFTNAAVYECLVFRTSAP